MNCGELECVHKHYCSHSYQIIEILLETLVEFGLIDLVLTLLFVVAPWDYIYLGHASQR